MVEKCLKRVFYVDSTGDFVFMAQIAVGLSSKRLRCFFVFSIKSFKGGLDAW